MMLLEKLIQWQTQQARKEGVETFRVLPYKTLVELSQVMPSNELELLDVKGIGAVKVKRYGTVLLAILKDNKSASIATPSAQNIVDISLDGNGGKSIVSNKETGEVVANNSDDVFSVGDFLSALNVLMSSHFGRVRVRGEIVDFRHNHTGHAYFQIKDGSGVIRVTVFRGAYELSGVELADGVEVIVTGYPQHHAQYGFSFIGETVELAGEGALKKAYDALKKKCTDEGLLAQSRKRNVPIFATRIGLITSRDSAAIGDFTTNLNAYGLHVSFVHSAVEGQHAVHDLSAALRTLHREAAQGKIDVLVLTRGGGSLESLQAFNNENIIRMIADFPVPVIAGIGHERDETLATLVADIGVSTPTAAAKAVCASWADATAHVQQKERVIVQSYSTALLRTAQRVAQAPTTLMERFDNVLRRFAQAEQKLTQHLFACTQTLQRKHEQIAQSVYRMQRSQQQWILSIHTRLVTMGKLLTAHNPQKLLARGYAIVRGKNGIVRKTEDVSFGEELSVQVSDGIIKTVVEK